MLTLYWFFLALSHSHQFCGWKCRGLTLPSIAPLILKTIGVTPLRLRLLSLLSSWLLVVLLLHTCLDPWFLVLAKSHCRRIYALILDLAYITELTVTPLFSHNFACIHCGLFYHSWPRCLWELASGGRCSLVLKTCWPTFFWLPCQDLASLVLHLISLVLVDSSAKYRGVARCLHQPLALLDSVAEYCPSQSSKSTMYTLVFITPARYFSR